MQTFRIAETPVPQTVLLVDDEAALRVYVANVLRRGGFQVVEAGDGLDALAVLTAMRGCVDVLVTDVRMPRMTGIELVAAVKLEFPGIPVVFISGEQLRDALHNPDDGGVFLQKPFGPQAFLDAVRAVSNRASRANGHGGVSSSAEHAGVIEFTCDGLNRGEH